MLAHDVVDEPKDGEHAAHHGAELRQVVAERACICQNSDSTEIQHNSRTTEKTIVKSTKVPVPTVTHHNQIPTPPSITTTTNMSSAARAFEQRSAAAVAQVVAELDNAPAVSETAASSPALAAGGLDFRAAQIAEDAKLAEELQREEYRQEEARTERRRQRRAAAEAERNTSWADWLMGTGPASGAAPGGNNTSSSAARSAPARGGARVAAPSGSIFACVAQSVSSVMGPPEGGQVNGVDSTRLL